MHGRSRFSLLNPPPPTVALQLCKHKLLPPNPFFVPTPLRVAQQLQTGVIGKTTYYLQWTLYALDTISTAMQPLE